MKKYIKYTSIVFTIILGLLIALYIGASIYIKINKKEIIATITKNIEKNFHSTVTIDDITIAFFEHFPNLSLEIKNISVKGPMYEIHGKKLFSAKKVYISIETYKLLIGKINFGKNSIEDGNIFIYTDSTGLSNLHYFSSSNKKPKNNTSLDLPQNIEFKNIDVTIQDVYREKYFSLLLNNVLFITNKRKDSTEVNINQNIYVKGLGFNLTNGSFLKNKSLVGKYKIVLTNKNTTMDFNNIQMNISKQPFQFSGKFHFGDSGFFNLEIKTDKINYAFAKSLLTNKIEKALSIVQIDAPININTSIQGSLNGGDPLVLAKWKIINASLNTPLINFKKATVSGYFSNELVKNVPRKDPNSTIHIDSLFAEWEGIPVKATKIEVNDLNKPMVIGSFVSNFELASFNKIVNSEAIEFSNGLGNVKVNYAGPLNGINNHNAKIHIQFMLNKGSLVIKPMGIKLSDCLADLSIENANLILHSMVAKGNKGSEINIWGNAKNIFSFLENVPGKASVDLNIYSPFLNMFNLAGFLISPQKKAIKKSNSSFQKSISKLNTIVENGQVRIQINANKISYNQLLATSFKSSILLSDGNWNVNTLHFNLAGGSFGIKASLHNTPNNQHPVYANFFVRNMDASKFFYAFSDFGSKEFGHKNITGKLNLSGHINGTMNAAGILNKHTAKATLQFSVKKGSLKNVAILENIQKSIFKKRNFSEIQFAEIKNRIQIQNGFVNIPRMQIESSVLGGFIEGQYGLEGNTDIRIQVPISNLNNKKDIIPLLSKKNSKAGMSIFLRAKSDNNGKLSIGYDAFGRFRKTNVQKENSPIHHNN